MTTPGTPLGEPPGSPPGTPPGTPGKPPGGPPGEPPAPPPAPPPPPDRCPWPGCDGRIEATGFCSTRGHRARRGAPPVPDSPPTAGTRRRAETDRLFTVGPAEDGLLDLPYIATPSPEALVVADPRVPAGGKTCGHDGCTAIVGRPYAGQPALPTGFCERCGHPYDFTPRLAPGDLVGEQYRVVGCVANGGLGWVYLAHDIRLEGNPVALKGLINTRDPIALHNMGEERRNLIRSDHPDIVRIINFVTHPEPGAGGTADGNGEGDGNGTGDTESAADRDGDGHTRYIVMEFVRGMLLSQVRDRITRREGPFGEDRIFEYVLSYGCRILDALESLHRKNYVYCDLKPNNVMHYADRIKLIDLGATRELGDESGVVLGARGFTAPEVVRLGARGLSVRSDLFSLGMTLRALSDDSGRQPEGLGAESYRRAVSRATAEDPLDRFASAREMGEQLRGVLREIRSLRTGTEHPEPSTLFAPAATLLDASLGRVPPLERWLTGERRPLLDPGLPAADRVPRHLPVPYPDPADPAAALLGQPTAGGPRRLIQQLSASGHESVEIRLRQLRAHLELGELGAAEQRLTAAKELLGHLVPHDWRIAWHEGLLHLARHEPAAAQARFDRVYHDLPGEYAPKLALGYCAEQRGDAESAERYYQAVWQRNRSQGSAAFGLARLRLTAGDRTGAAGLLGGLPEVSRHYDAGRIACVRILSGRLHPDPARGLPGRADLAAALDLLPRLYLDEGHPGGPARDRLEAETLEVALERVRAGATAGGPGGGAALFGADDEEFALRSRLEAKLRRLARQAPTPGGLAALVDLANRVRPKTRF
ncbi:tetratricopeptide repeat protein [Streptomyces telluris]|uniref:non-specific serine/threonine protein kinase n=1 Tax=Streptomyces telluris TaxID=2720021 RepID=A0A9X2LKH2_9ACTN|nr:tetratricopeptide repeat protein [Streptomyces telluris]MCQ8772969.1 protein kinase [Streptomyces telluris]NJP78317.1 protein kinase [Streptomyces telluris]